MKLIWFLIALGLFCGSTLAADVGGIDCQVMTDTEALAIRGQGYRPTRNVQAFGSSFAAISVPGGTAHSENGYAAVGETYASGVTGSHAFTGGYFESNCGCNRYVPPGVYAGGTSTARAK